ncbi:hypothetical protein [Foetidibacter luteolus]|uniref:hypothetical protein n=1 Tax=Foetidibacter luteolus TaxID=2608880 RepID=UPI00129ABC66|nr:hypothetical protein [Foetidibacter luteolus]
MTVITDEFMQQQLALSKEYTMVLLKPGPEQQLPNARDIIWEHARKNFQLRADGKVAVVAPVTTEADVNGLYVFNITPAEVKTIMDEDPAIKAGIFTYEIYPLRSFPGDKLGEGFASA